MIERMQVRNFQTHSLLRIKFDPLITTILGKTGAGKSAILRALRWVMFNKPNGTDFIKHGEESCEVKLWVDGKCITRKRGKDENLYALDGKEFKAFGSDVPHEIQKLLNVDAINFQGQHDAPFWFSDTPGQVAKNLNAIVNLESIDEALTAFATETRAASGAVEYTEQRKAQAESETVKYQDLPKLERALVNVEAIHAQWQGHRDRLARLGLRLSELDRHEAQIGPLQTAIDTGVKWKVILGKAKTEHDAANDQYTRLNDWLNQLNCLRERLIETERNLDKAKFQLKQKTGGMCPICQNPLKS